MKATPMLNVQHLSKSFGALTLFDDINFSVAEGQRVGLMGRNGTGKSTLLSIISGKEGHDEGRIVFKSGLKVGMLEQSPKFNSDETVLDACFNHHGDESLVLKAKQILTRLKINRLDQPVGQLSGGQQKRVALANVLITEPDLLILDEPTNHLDLEITEWLEDYLAHGKRTLLMVTHDRYFLDRVCSVILELDDKCVYTYHGNYAYYLEKRQERIDAHRAEAARANNLYRTELEWMRRMPQARGHKAKYRENAFYELQKKARLRIVERQIRLKAGNAYIGSKIFECQNVSKAWSDDCVIIRNFNYNFARFEKMGIVGNNGTGKSTFIKMLLGQIVPDSGTICVGDTVRFGYFSQDGQRFDRNKKVIDVITDIADCIDTGRGHHLSAAQFLQYFLFSPEQQQNYVYKLSGGEQRRLYLCSVLMHNPNFLVLDEPTNDMDIVTLQILEEYLADFPGCVIVVSHDRYFMDKVVDHLLVFKGQGVIQDFPGNYTQYREWVEAERRANNVDKTVKSNTVTVVKPTVPAPVPSRHRLSYKEKRELAQLETDITALETEQKVIEDRLCGGLSDIGELTRISKRLAEIKEELDMKSDRWLELSDIEQ